MPDEVKCPKCGSSNTAVDSGGELIRCNNFGCTKLYFTKSETLQQSRILELEAENERLKEELLLLKETNLNNVLISDQQVKDLESQLAEMRSAMEKMRKICGEAVNFNYAAKACLEIINSHALADPAPKEDKK